MVDLTKASFSGLVMDGAVRLLLDRERPCPWKMQLPCSLSIQRPSDNRHAMTSFSGTSLTEYRSAAVEEPYTALVAYKARDPDK